jgi:hypothetical protein
LLDANGNELAHSVGSLTSTQPLGSYYVQIQPETGAGFYTLTIRQVVTAPPVITSSVSTVVVPTIIPVGGTSVATVSLNSVPAGGYTSAEFTCTYDPALVEVSNIAEAVPGLFGADAATATHGPQNGSFIFAVAGSNGNKATTNGAVFTFNLKGLQVGQAIIECKARVSTGGVLSDISSADTVSATLTITNDGTLTGQVLACKPVTIHLNANPFGPFSGGTFSLTAPAGTYTTVASAAGFLSAQGTATLTAANTTTMPTVSLLAGDIDNDGVIGQLDALTIGMNYNLAAPAAADLNCDGTINVLDLELLASNYRAIGPTAWQ